MTTKQSSPTLTSSSELSELGELSRVHGEYLETVLSHSEKSLVPRASTIHKKKQKTWKGKKKPSSMITLESQREEAMKPYNKYLHKIKGITMYCSLCASEMDGKDFYGHQCVDDYEEEIISQGSAPYVDLEALLFS